MVAFLCLTFHVPAPLLLVLPFTPVLIGSEGKQNYFKTKEKEICVFAVVVWLNAKSSNQQLTVNRSATPSEKDFLSTSGGEEQQSYHEISWEGDLSPMILHVDGLPNAREDQISET